MEDDKFWNTLSEMVVWYKNKTWEKIVYFREEIMYSCLFAIAVGFFLDAYLASRIVGWLLMVIGTVMVVWNFKIRFEKAKNQKNIDRGPSIFLDDGISENSDELNYVPQAQHFAKQVVNNHASESFVFGLDAPWGTGKSSFLKMCEKDWRKNDEVLVFYFNPIIFHGTGEGMAVIFAREFKKFIKRQKNIDDRNFLATLDDVQRVLSKIDLNIGILNIKGSTFTKGETAHQIIESLSNHAKNLNQNIVIVIDDLDRLFAKEVRSIFGAVRNIFNIPNINFVLCYDSENIVRLERSASGNDTMITLDYMEKFVQIKFNLLPEKSALKNLFIKYLEMDRNEDNAFREVITKCFDENFEFYRPLVGTPRKIKRCINVIRYRALVSYKFAKMDFDLNKMFKLILIYLNYPEIFAEMYYADNHDGDGATFEKGFLDHFQNNSNHGRERKAMPERLKEYIQDKKKNSFDAAFLLHEIFCQDCEASGCKDRFPRKSSHDSLGGNEDDTQLSAYINLIYAGEEQDLGTHRKFHIDNVKEMSRTDVGEILQSNEYIGREGSHDFLFVQVQSVDESVDTVSKVIEYLVSHIHKYSFLPGIGAYKDSYRNDIALRLYWILDKRGWSDEDGRFFNNSDENVSKIIEYIFGENQKPSIMDGLLDEDHDKLLATLDAIRFTITLRHDSGSGFHITEAIKNYNNSSSDEGALEKELVSRIFRFFDEHFIKKGVCFIDYIFGISDDVLFGDYKKQIMEEFKKSGDKEPNLESVLHAARMNFMQSIMWNFGSSDKESLGQYAIGEFGIREHFQNYLKQVCFPLKSCEEKHAVYLIDYCLRTLDHVTRRYKFEWMFQLSSFEKTFDKEWFAEYWRTNHEFIEGVVSKHAERKLWTYNYNATYGEDAQSIVDAFNEMYLNKENVHNESSS